MFFPDWVKADGTQTGFLCDSTVPSVSTKFCPGWWEVISRSACHAIGELSLQKLETYKRVVVVCLIIAIIIEVGTLPRMIWQAAKFAGCLSRVESVHDLRVLLQGGISTDA